MNMIYWYKTIATLLFTVPLVVGCNRARSSLHDGQIVTITDKVQNQVIYRDGAKVHAVTCEVGITEKVLTRNDCPINAKRDSSLSYKKEYLPELKRYLDFVDSSELQSEIDAIDTILAELGAEAITESVNAERTGDGGFVRDSFAKQKDLLRKQREKLLESQSNYEIKSEIYISITTLLESPDSSKRLYHPGKAAVAMVFPFFSEEEKLKQIAVSRVKHGEVKATDPKARDPKAEILPNVFSGIDQVIDKDTFTGQYTCGKQETVRGKQMPIASNPTIRNYGLVTTSSTDYLLIVADGASCGSYSLREISKYNYKVSVGRSSGSGRLVHRIPLKANKSGDEPFVNIVDFSGSFKVTTTSVEKL